MERKIKIIWIISLILIVVLSLGICFYQYSHITQDEKYFIEWAEEEKDNIPYPNTFNVQDIWLNKKMGYAIINYHYQSKTGKNESFEEVWQIENNKISIKIGNLNGSKVYDLPIGYIKYTPQSLKELATKIKNNNETIQLNYVRLNRFIHK